jgi:hypothetical protein
LKGQFEMTKKKDKGTQAQANQPSIEELMAQLQAQKAELEALQTQNKELAAKAARKGGKQTFPPVLWGLARGIVGTFMNKVPKKPEFQLASLETAFSSEELKQAIETYLIKSTLANPFKTSDVIYIDGMGHVQSIDIEKETKQEGASKLADLLVSKFQSVIELIEKADKEKADKEKADKEKADKETAQEPEVQEEEKPEEGPDND